MGVVQRDDEVGRFGLYVIRQLNMSINQGIFKEAILEPRDLLGYTQVARTVERIASHASRMAKVVAGLEKPLPKPLVAKLSSMSEYAAGLVEEALLSLFKRDHGGADVVVEKAKRFIEMEDELRPFSGREGDSDVLHDPPAGGLPEENRRVRQGHRRGGPGPHHREGRQKGGGSLSQGRLIIDLGGRLVPTS